mgnify:CR=1 FL=1
MHGEKSKNITFARMRMENIQLVATDLDGTFLRNDKTISEKNLQALHQLGERKITRVVATGRNLRKVTEVIPSDVPFDYIVYSSGAGVYDWKNRRHLVSRNIAPHSSSRLFSHFFQKQYNFSVFAPAPGNHRLWYYRGNQQCVEFDRYLSFHDSLATLLPAGDGLEGELCQFLLIIPEDEKAFALLKKEIESQCDEIRVIRSSSPVTKGYIWVEIFHHQVSKGHGVHEVCNLLGISPDHTFGIGNDYNDLDLLHFTAHSYLTHNAPDELKTQFRVAPSNEKDAFARAVQPLIQ